MLRLKQEHSSSLLPSVLPSVIPETKDIVIISMYTSALEDSRCEIHDILVSKMHILDDKNRRKKNYPCASEKSREYLPSDTKNIFAVCNEKYRRRHKYSHDAWKNIRAKIISRYLAHLEIAFREVFRVRIFFWKLTRLELWKILFDSRAFISPLQLLKIESRFLCKKSSIKFSHRFKNEKASIARTA